MATITFWTDQKTKDELGLLAKKLDRKQSFLLNWALQQLLKTNGHNLDSVSSDEPIEQKGPRRKVTASLKPTEFVSVASMAAAQVMTPSTWVANLIKARIKKGQQLNSEELAALKESTRQLQALGRNINQLVRVTNIEWREAERLKREHLKLLARDIKAHTDKVSAMLKGNLERWTEEI